MRKSKWSLKYKNPKTMTHYVLLANLWRLVNSQNGWCLPSIAENLPNDKIYKQKRQRSESNNNPGSTTNNDKEAKKKNSKPRIMSLSLPPIFDATIISFNAPVPKNSAAIQTFPTSVNDYHLKCTWLPPKNRFHPQSLSYASHIRFSSQKFMQTMWSEHMFRLPVLLLL